MKNFTRIVLTFLGLGFIALLAGCTGVSYGVSSYHGSAWGYNRYDYYNDRYDDRRDRHRDYQKAKARSNYYHHRANPTGSRAGRAGRGGGGRSGRR